jgi:hypothetical protein
MRILLSLILLIVSVNLFAKEKVYYDAGKHYEVIDISGKKSIQEINTEYSGNYSDTTLAREHALELSNQDAEEKAQKEIEIQKVIRQMAIERMQDK